MEVKSDRSQGGAAVDTLRDVEDGRDGESDRVGDPKYAEPDPYGSREQARSRKGHLDPGRN